MKKTIVLFAATIALSSQASASWYQEYCSNGEGTTRVSSGHNDNTTTLTVRVWSNSGLSESTLDLSTAENIDMQVTNEKELSKESTQSCGTSGHGMWSGRTVNYRRVTFTKTDGGLFPKGTVGISKDRKSVQADLICEIQMNSETLCK